MKSNRSKNNGSKAKNRTKEIIKPTHIEKTIMRLNVLRSIKQDDKIDSKVTQKNKILDIIQHYAPNVEQAKILCSVHDKNHQAGFLLPTD